VHGVGVPMKYFRKTEYPMTRMTHKNSSAILWSLGIAEEFGNFEKFWGHSGKVAKTKDGIAADKHTFSMLLVWRCLDNNFSTEMVKEK
jgi:hypothetical protein